MHQYLDKYVGRGLPETVDGRVWRGRADGPLPPCSHLLGTSCVDSAPPTTTRMIPTPPAASLATRFWGSVQRGVSGSVTRKHERTAGECVTKEGQGDACTTPG